MATLDDLRASEAALTQAINDTTARVSAKLADLEARLAAAAPDLAPDVASIHADIAALGQVTPTDPTPTT